MLASALLVLLGVGLSIASGDRRDNRAKYPSLITLMAPDEHRIDSAFQVNTVEYSLLSAEATTEVASTTPGMTYLDFYADTLCTGEVTYSTGYRAGQCLPSNDYVRPPFTDEDDFYDNYPFQSLKIHNVTASCDGWYTTYYTDVNCTDVYKTTQMDDYTSCRPAESLQVSNLLSVRGKCTFSPNLPILSDSYIVSDYTGKTGCVQQELVMYTAYGFNTCFGYGNYSSTMFMPNTTAGGSVHETQYYSSTNCTRTGSEYGQSDYNIPVNTCNAVQTPNSPNEDDDVAYTEYIGHTMVVTPVPSARPTVRPSARPTAPPSSGASAAPTQNDLVLFAAQQVITGIDLATYNSNVTAYSLTLRQSIAACMAGVSSANIINLVVTEGASSSVHHQSNQKAVLSSTSQIHTAYDVSVRDASLSYSSLSSQLSTAVESGQFDTYLTDFAQQTGAVGFVDATSTTVTTEDLEPSDDDDDKKTGFTSGEIAGVVVGSLAVLLILGTLSYFVGQHRKGRRMMSTAAPPPTSNVGVVDAHPLEYEDPAVAKSRRGPSPASPSRSSAHRMEEGASGTVNPLAAKN